jgi:hypothetical protein
MDQHKAAQALTVASLGTASWGILTASAFTRIAHTHTHQQDAAVPVEESTSPSPRRR